MEETKWLQKPAILGMVFYVLLEKYMRSLVNRTVLLCTIRRRSQEYLLSGMPVRKKRSRSLFSYLFLFSYSSTLLPNFCALLALDTEHLRIQDIHKDA